MPRRPPAVLVREAADVATWTGPLWRVHRTSGNHLLGWHQLRHFGPLHQCRWDPHPSPRGEHPGHGVLYAAGDPTTALAEVYQVPRSISLSEGQPALTSWHPTRPLRLLDLTSTWALRNHASFALNTADRSTCRAWARAVHSTWPDLDGLLTSSTMTGRPAVTLFDAAADTFPELPAFSRPLAHPALAAVMQRAAGEIGYGLRP